MPGATAAAQKCLPLPRLGSARPSGLHGNGLRGRLLIRNESFLSSAPFPHSHLCGCFCLKQIGLRVDEAAPVGKAVSVAAALRPASRGGSAFGEERWSSGSSQLGLPARAAGQLSARWRLVQALEPCWPASWRQRSVGTGTAALPCGRSMALGNLPASGALPLDQIQPLERPWESCSPVRNGLWKRKLNTVLMNLGVSMRTEQFFSVCCLLHKEF